MSRSSAARAIPSEPSGPAPAGASAAAPPSQITLAPTGKRKMKFNGQVIAHAANPAPGQDLCHEVTLYLRDRGGVVLAIRACHPGAPENDVTAVWRADTTSDALAELYIYDAGANVPVAIDPEDPALCPAEMTAAALHLRAQVETTRQRFAQLRAELHEQLERAGLA